MAQRKRAVSVLTGEEIERIGAWRAKPARDRAGACPLHQQCWKCEALFPKLATIRAKHTYGKPCPCTQFGMNHAVVVAGRVIKEVGRKRRKSASI